MISEQNRRHSQIEMGSSTDSCRTIKRTGCKNREENRIVHIDFAPSYKFCRTCLG